MSTNAYDIVEVTVISHEMAKDDQIETLSDLEQT